MRSYIVETGSGRLYLRNRKFIKRRKKEEENEEEEEEEEKEGRSDEGKQQVMIQQRELSPPTYEAVVAGRIPAGPLTRSRTRAQRDAAV